MSAQTAFTGCSPNLLSTDLPRALTFYRDVLGFQEVNRWEHEGQLLWLHVVNGPVTLMFQARSTMVGDMPELATAQPTITGGLFITVPDIDALWQRLQNHPNVTHALRKQPYGREFVLRDPDGYLLVLSQVD